ncbi:MAG: alpha-galactosidase [Clostridiales bacterium]|nr:alpha-galactosidase [Clostridiales bacterium]
MPILFDKEKQVFKLDTSSSSYIMRIYKENYLCHLYYGAKIPDYNLTDHIFKGGFASFCPENINIPGAGFSPGVCTFEFPGENTGDFRESAVSIRNADGNNATDFRYAGHIIYSGKKPIDGMPSLYSESPEDCETLEIEMIDSFTGIKAVLYYTVFEKLSAMTRRVAIVNPTDKSVKIERIYSLCCDFNTRQFDMISLYGRWLKERTVQRQPLFVGTQSVGSKRGSSGHYRNPFGAIVGHDTTEDYGDAYGFNLVYSSNFKFNVEVDGHGGARVLMGINPDTFNWQLNPGDSFDAPEAVMVYSANGLGEMSRTFHRLYLNHLIRGKYKHVKRPVLINNWEATGMNFTGEKLLTFAQRAKELGLDMLVMDDGWFGARDDDTSSLGDWVVNEEKLGCTLKEFTHKVHQIGLKFGIWFEPEMISRDSDLYRAHPDWCVHVPGREKSIARHQYVLDYSRKDVRDHIYSMIKKILSENEIDYVKWDFNRNLSEAGSALLSNENQQEVFHRCVLGTYDIMNRLTTDFPDILLENCSGGGGRFDPAMLYYSPQIWCSDNTDPIERLSIQFGTSLCYPASTMGAHVSASKRAGYETKGNVALWGTFGYELDPNKFTDEEKEIVKEQIKEYHKYYDLIHYGDLYRLIDPLESGYKAAWMFVDEEKTQALFTCVVIKLYEDLVFYLKLKGLDKDAYYRCSQNGEVYSGALLMNAGLNLSDYPNTDGESFKLFFEKIS